MKLRLLAVGMITTSTALAGLAFPLTAFPASAASSGVTLRVGSFNIASVAGDASRRGAHRKWKYRRAVVARQILSRHLDVVGLQEASQSRIYKRAMRYGVNQYMDLVGKLNSMGGHYAVTRKAEYNCRRVYSKKRCHYRYRGASGGTRIIYNTSTLRLVKAGAYGYRHHRRHGSRYMAFAYFASKQNGKQFFFADTHLEPRGKTIRKRQWSELIKQVNHRRNGRKVVVVGDFNSSKYDRYTRTYLPKMKHYGYGDTINQSYGRSTVRSRRASATKNAWIGSFNGWRRNVNVYGYHKDKRKIGNSIDWIFASNSMPVTMWEVVCDYNSNHRVTGTMPSDHNMVRADLRLS
jgi:endonuclease/exonuclease/phosphatase family metal-dependent hydrolase